jgi:hypothetical protein
VRDGALQGARLPERGDHLGCAALKLFQRVITDVEDVQKRTNWSALLPWRRSM